MLADWDSFYVIVGSASAVLIGLMFVVITLRGGDVTSDDETAMRAFGTPTIVHFGVVLLLAGLLTMPRQSIFSLHICIVSVAVVGIGYVIRAFVLARRQKSYAPVMSDWVWHVALPSVAYVHLLFTGFAVAHSARSALYGVAGTSLALLYIGIRNAWDAAVWIATTRGDMEKQ